MSYVSEKREDAIEEIHSLLRSEVDTVYIVEEVSRILSRLDFSHDPSKPLGEQHTCFIYVRGYHTVRNCYCNATEGNDHEEYETGCLIGVDGKRY